VTISQQFNDSQNKHPGKGTGNNKMSVVMDFLGALRFPAGTFLINLAAMSALNFGLYYRRYHDKELVITSSLFNVFIFCVLTTLSAANVGMAAGFGLFAFLAMFTMRSEPLSKAEMTYLFGSVAIAVICAVNGKEPLLALIITAVLLVAVYVVDHPLILSQSSSAKVMFDRIDLELLSNPAAMRASLSERLSVNVLNYQVTQVDYINDMVKLNVYFRKH
jgi:Domain of unknown function (DUF4956)